MSFVKHLRKALTENNSLQKKEDPQAYAKMASTGFILAHPVKIKGQDKRHDNNIPYHSTIKFFDKEGDNEKQAHEVASQLDHQHIDPKKVGIKTKVLKDRNGNDVYAVGLHGHHAKKMEEHHNKLSHMGNKENYKWGAHISVPKSVHDEIKEKGHKTAHDAGIEFGHAELRRGPKTLQTYHPKKEKLVASEKFDDSLNKKEIFDVKLPSKLNLEKGEKDISEKSLADIQRDTAWTWASRAAACYEKLAKTGDWKWKNDAEEYRHEAVEHAALIGDTHPYVLEEIHQALEKYRKISEKEAVSMDKSEDLEKGALKNMLTAGAMAGALASAAPAEVKAPTTQLHPQISTSQGYSRDKVLNAISQIESSGGKNLNHKPTSMGTAYGKFAEMPDVIHDTIRLNPDLKRKYAKALRLKGDQLSHYMQDNPGLEQELANKHLGRLEHHFGQNPDAISYAWNHGIVGTNRALKQKQNLAEHPYVQKFKQIYEKEK